MHRIFLSVLILASSCQCQKSETAAEKANNSDATTPTNPRVTESTGFPIQDYLAQESIQKALTEEKVFTMDIKEGDGESFAKDKHVTVHFEAWLKNGNLFDTTAKRGGEMRFLSGAGRVIIGLEQGMQGMNVGGERLIVIPPRLAYGRAGIEKRIPPNAHLIYHLTLSAMEQ